ncbi:MAG: hypothetical protein ACPLZF_05700 [Nitrososphaeria archaeon]
MSKTSRPKYGLYGTLLFVILIAFCSILYFGNIFVNFEIYLSIILTGLGVYTLVYSFFYKAVVLKNERNYMILWGYVVLSLGLALLFDMFTGNFMLNISVAIFVGAILALLSIKFA